MASLAKENSPVRSPMQNHTNVAHMATPQSSCHTVQKASTPCQFGNPKASSSTKSGVDEEFLSPNQIARRSLRKLSTALVDEADAISGCGDPASGLKKLLQTSPKTIRKVKAWCKAQNMDLELSVNKVYKMFEGQDLRSATKAELTSALKASFEMQSLAKRQNDLNKAFSAAGGDQEEHAEKVTVKAAAVADTAEPPPPPLASNVTVVVRVRPLAVGKVVKENDKASGRRAQAERCCTVSADVESQGLVAISKKGSSTAVLASQAQPQKSFYAFDDAYGEQSTTRDIYERVFVRRRFVSILLLVRCCDGNTEVRFRNCRYIDSLTAGVSVTIFAYGATGSGKTFTMMGAGSAGLSQVKSSKDEENSRHDGLTQMVLQQLCEKCAKQRKSGSQVSLEISYLEIYNENIYDLLADKQSRGKKLKACEGNAKSNGAVSVLNLSTHNVTTAQVRPRDTC